MGVKDILVKLAEKEAMKGNQDFAYNLVVLAESGKCKGCGKKSASNMCSKCSKITNCSLKSCDVKKAYGEMHKVGDKCYCCAGCAKKDKKNRSALSNLIMKYAGHVDPKCKDCGNKKCTCSAMTACAGSMCKAKMQKRHMHKADGKHYCCSACAMEHMDKKAYASDMLRKYSEDFGMGDDNFSGDMSDNGNPYSDDPVRGPVWQEGYDAGMHGSDSGDLGGGLDGDNSEF